VFVVSVWWRAIQRGTDTECYCVCCECLVEGEDGLINVFVLQTEVASSQSPHDGQTVIISG
jgi:hypothetical protein